MGDVIRKDAPADDIFADLGKTLENAEAKGGKWNELALHHLGPVSTLHLVVDDKLKEARTIFGGFEPKIGAQDTKSDRLLGRVHDDIWNLLDRPGNDPFLDLLFPGGISFYAEGADDDQPDKMDLLAELLEADIHPRLDAAKGKGFAGEILADSKVYRTLLEPARPARARVKLLERVRTAIAKSAAMKLADLKRAYKSERFTEADIHTVIPNRPRTPAKPKPAKPKPDKDPEKPKPDKDPEK